MSCCVDSIYSRNDPTKVLTTFIDHLGSILELVTYWCDLVSFVHKDVSNKG